jgi:hypothetical protein
MAGDGGNMPAFHKGHKMNNTNIEKLKPFLCDFISFYYNELGNCTGGNYHIVLDDGNLDAEYIWFGQEESEKEGDTFGIFLGQLLRFFKVEELEDPYEKRWNLKDAHP